MSEPDIVDISSDLNTGTVNRTDVDEEVHTSRTRQRKPTEEFAQWQLQQRINSFNTSISAWRKCANNVQVVVSDMKDVAVLRHERVVLNDAMNRVTTDYEKL